MAQTKVSEMAEMGAYRDMIASQGGDTVFHDRELKLETHLGAIDMVSNVTLESGTFYVIAE